MHKLRQILTLGMLGASSLALGASAAVVKKSKKQVAPGVQLYKKQAYEKAAPLLFDLYKRESGAAQLKTAVMLGDALRKIQLPYSASHFFLEVLKKSRTLRAPEAASAIAGLAQMQKIAPLSLGVYESAFLGKGAVNLSRTAANFYYYTVGRSEFARQRLKTADDYFANVRGNDEYAVKAKFHAGVIDNFRGKADEGIAAFEKVIDLADQASNQNYLVQQANFNIARIYYERGQYSKSISYYAKIQRLSEPWPQAIFESAWAFLLMEKPNNVLGNLHTLHSPFYEQRFFPESYILKAITLLKLCAFDRVKDTLETFKARFSPAMREAKSMIDANKGRHEDFFRLVQRFSNSNLDKYKDAWPIIDSLMRSDAYMNAIPVIENVESELSALERVPSSWRSNGFASELEKVSRGFRASVTKDAGERLYADALRAYQYLAELHSQSKLITAELLLGKVDELRAKLNVTTADKKDRFIGGLTPLKVGDKLEYWPFQGEYWKDELGGYVYNIPSRCK